MARSEGRNAVVPVVSAQHVRETGGRVIVPIPGHEECEQPVIELIREGDVVQAIDITCPCGRRFRVLCDYEGLAGP